MMNGWAWLLIGYFILLSAVTVLVVGEEAKPMTPGIALLRLFVSAGMIAAVFAAVGVI